MIVQQPTEFETNISDRSFVTNATYQRDAQSKFSVKIQPSQPCRGPYILEVVWGKSGKTHNAVLALLPFSSQKGRIYYGGGGGLSWAVYDLFNEGGSNTGLSESNPTSLSLLKPSAP